jgi:hypothetical protein
MYVDKKSTWSPTWEVVNKGAWFTRICVMPMMQIMIDHNIETIINVRQSYFNIFFFPTLTFTRHQFKRIDGYPSQLLMEFVVCVNCTNITFTT